MSLLSFSALAAFVVFTAVCSGSTDHFINSTKYNEGEYGRYVTQNFRTASVKAPKPNLMMPFSACDDGSKLFLSPRGMIPKGEGSEGPMIFDLKCANLKGTTSIQLILNQWRFCVDT